MKKLKGNILGNIKKCIPYCINSLMIIILGYLLCMSLFNTCYVNYVQKVYYINKSSILAIISIVAAIVICSIIVYYRNKINKITFAYYFDAYYKYILVGIFALLVIMMFFIIRRAGLQPISDQAYCLNAARNFIDGDYSAWEHGGYCMMYPNQNGIVLFEAVIMKIFGADNIIVFQYLNLICIVISVAIISNISNILWGDSKLHKLALLIVYLFYTPLMFYVTFIYGTIYGFMFMILSIYFLLKYLKKYDKKYLLLSILFIVISCYFKNNYQVAFVAFILALAYDGIFNKKKWSVIGIVLSLCLFVGMTQGSIKIIESISNKSIESGTPYTAWIAMGMQEGPYANGWYNEYNYKIMQENNYDSKKVNEIAKDNINESFNKFLGDKKYALEFYEKKIISQWCEPTFSSLFVQGTNRDKLNTKQLEFHNALIEDNGKLHNIYLNIFRYIQIIIYFGSLMYFIFKFKDIRVKQLLIPLIFIGGFNFHIIWEANTKYTFVYFILLIVYAFQGFIIIAKDILKYISKDNIKNIYKSKVVKTVITLLIIIVIVNIMPY